MNRSLARYRPTLRHGLLVALLGVIAVVAVGSVLVPDTGSHPSSVPAPVVGHPAPDFTLALFGGHTLRMTSLRGNVVLLNFWATWCIPCRSEMPRLTSWYRRYRGHHLIVLGIDKQEPSSDVHDFTRRFHVTYPIAIDESGATLDTYRVIPLPASFLVDSSGIIRSVKYGPLDSKYFTSTVLPLIRS